MTVQYSIQKMVSDGTLSTIALGIQYLQRNAIYMRVAGEETPQSGAPSGYTWSFINNTTLKILPVVPNGVEVVVYRRTDVDAMYNIYSQNAQFDEATIDENNQQLLYIAQEYLEQGIPGAGVDTLEFVRDDGINTYYRIKRTDGSYSDEFAVPSAGSATKILARESLRRSYAEAGYNLVAGSFEAGGTVTYAMDVLLYEADGHAYNWDGVFPVGGKVVPQNSTPVTTGGVGPELWLDKANDTLRSKLAQVSGPQLMGFQQSGADAAVRTADEKLKEIHSVEDFQGSDDYDRFVKALVSSNFVLPTDTSYSLSTLVEGNVIQFSHVEYTGTAPVNRNVGYGCNIFSKDMTPVAVNNTAVGDGVMTKLTEGYGNTGVGRSVLKSVTTGLNNTGVGYNVMVNTTTAFNNTAVGRNALLENTTGSENCAYGWASQQRTTTGENNSSYGRSTLEFNVTGSFNNCLGATAMFHNTTGSYNQSIGCSSLWNNLIGNYNIAIGTDSLFNSLRDGNTAVGHFAGKGITLGQYNVAIGRNALSKEGAGTGDLNVAIGNAAMSQGVVSGTLNVAVGQSSMLQLTSGTSNTAVGSDSLGKVTTGNQNTGLGNFSLNFDQAGNPHNYGNCTGVGHSTRVSGSNQVQLGNAATTTYVYGTVQNRSDARDKTDVRDTSLGIEFIMGLRPVDGRWDMRDDYWEEYDEQVGVDAEGWPVFETKRRQIPKDGSRARQRKHHWFIAQEVKELCDKLGVDFGGYQDHSVNGGCDVKTLGYDEFIPPTVKAVQQCWARLNDIEARIAKLEA